LLDGWTGTNREFLVISASAKGSVMVPRSGRVLLLLKALRHGSETPTRDAFLAVVDLDVVVISASMEHDLPKPTVVARYEEGERLVLRTDLGTDADNDHVVCGLVAAKVKGSAAAELLGSEKSRSRL
jgi:hypothetical protein